MNMNLKYIVYITINLCNGKFYIGVHKTNPEIFDGYIGCGVRNKGDANLNTPLHRAIRKYGYENFKRTTISVFDTKDEALNLEKQIVTERLVRSKFCYNATIGGNIPPINSKKVYKFALDGNYLRSYKSVIDAARDLNKEVLEKSIANEISMVCRGELRSAYGFYWSFIKVFNYNPYERKKKIAQYTLGGKFLRYYDSIEEAEINGSGQIYRALNGNGTSMNYQWRYYEEDNSDILPIKRYQKPEKSIIMMDKNENIISEYESILKCIEINTNLKKSGIYNVLCGLQKTYKGFKFKYKNDDIV